MSYDEAQRKDAPSPVLSDASLPRQDRAKIDPPPGRDRTDMKALEEAEADSEANYQPNTVKFWMVMLGLYFALFVVALVSFHVIPTSSHLSRPRKHVLTNG